MRINLKNDTQSHLSSHGLCMSSRDLIAGSKKIINTWIPRSSRGMTAGYTLLELLLVIAILAVLAAFGLNMYQQHTNEIKVEKTALQMQQILQSASAYYIDNGCWPNSPQCSNALPFSAYLPVGNDADLWGGNYQLKPLGKKFQIVSSQNIPPLLIPRIIARLPAAVPDNPTNPKQIIAETAIPTAVQAQANILIKKIGITPLLSSYDDYIIPTNITCPSGWRPHVEAGIYDIRADKAPGSWVTGSKIIYELGAYPYCINAETPNSYRCDVVSVNRSLTGYPDPESDYGQATYLYIAYCGPK